jgi:hypothetical protein
MAPFFEIDTQDEMDNFWVVFEDDKDACLQVRPHYRDLLCPRCQSFDAHAVVARGLPPDVVVTHRKGAFTTNDGFLVVTEPVQSVLASLAGPDLLFHPLPGDPSHVLVLPCQPAPPQVEEAAVELAAPCPACQRRSYRRCHPERLTLPQGWVFGGLVFPAHRTLWAKWIGSKAAVQALKAVRSRGWLFEPLVPPVPKPPRSRPGVVTLAGVQIGGPGVAFSPDGQWLAYTGGHDLKSQQEVIVWATQMGEPLWQHRARGRAFLRAAFAPDGGKLAVIGFGNRLTLFEAATGTIALTANIPGVGDIGSLAYSPDGGTLACTHQRTAYLLDSRTGAIRGQFELDAGLQCLAFSPDGSSLACGGFCKTDVCSLGSGQRKTLTDNQGMVPAVAFSPDGRLLASAGTGKNRKGELLLWQTESWTLQHRIACHRSSVDALAFSPEGRVLATGGEEKSVILWDVPSGKKVATLKDHVAGKLGLLGLAFAPNGRRLACADPGGADVVGRVTLYDLDALWPRPPAEQMI